MTQTLAIESPADTTGKAELGSLLPELTAALAVEAARAERLIARLEHSVAQGDRMLAELGLAA